LAAIALTLVMAAPGSALATPASPLLMDAHYVERERDAGAARSGCAVTIAGLTDTRRSPETVGIITGVRAIHAPADREAWFRSVIETGLQARGFTPTFAPAPAEPVAAESTEAGLTEPAAGPDVLTLRINLRSVWLASLGMNKTGSVVLQMSAARGAQNHQGYYRGEHISPNWANGRGEFNEHLDRTFAEALDAMAADLRPMCTAS
jgi:hypothetical protein